MPAERFDFPNAKGEKLAACSTCRTARRAPTALFAHCFTCGKNVVAAKRIADALTALGHRGAALRFHRHRIERGRVRQHHVLVQCRRSGRRRRSSAQDAAGAGAADRPQPRRRGGAGRGGRDPGGEGGGDDRRAQRSRPCHASVQGQARCHRRARRGRGRARRPAVPHPPRVPGRRCRAASSPNGLRACARRC